MIKKLPLAVVNQIAAGEVVERPVSVIKELVENSLDAGASRIRVEVRGGGAEMMAVIDDGEGFTPEDLPLAFASHATSKLADVADLDHIGSLGFRGEALASIGAVARARIQSRRHDADEGWEVRCDGGVETAPQPCGCPAGTRIEIRDLFFNVPARRRFLKVAHAERSRIQQLLSELALARLDVDFTLVADDKELLRLPRGVSLAERVQQCFGRELGVGLLPVSRRFDGISIEGVIGEPDLARRDGRLELMFVNGRLASEKSALYATRQAYREYLMGGRFPVYVLQVALPAEQVDVNIHPRKAEVRFVESRKVAGCLHETVKAALQARTLGSVSGGHASVSGGHASDSGGHASDSGGGLNGDRGAGVQISSDLPRARSGFPQATPGLFGAGPPVVVSRSTSSVAAGVDPTPIVREPQQPWTRQTQAAARPNPFRRAAGRFLQVMDLYLLLEGDDGLLVVDQHALHERVTYERLRREHAARAVQVQRLLVPAVVELTPVEIGWIESVQEQLAAEGLLVERFGPNAVAVHGMPLVLSRTDPRQLMRALATGEHDDGSGSVREHIAERFHSMACRGSVMSGDHLTDEEIEALLVEAATLEHPHNCPHGRPTVLTFSTAELERYFRRRC